MTTINSYNKLLLTGQFSTEANCAQYLLDKKILPTHKRCSCGRPMIIVPCSTSRYRIMLGMWWLQIDLFTSQWKLSSELQSLLQIVHWPTWQVQHQHDNNWCRSSATHLTSSCQKSLQDVTRKDCSSCSNDTYDRRAGDCGWSGWGQVWQTKVPAWEDSERLMGLWRSTEEFGQLLSHTVFRQQEKCWGTQCDNQRSSVTRDNNYYR